MSAKEVRNGLKSHSAALSEKTAGFLRIKDKKAYRLMVRHTMRIQYYLKALVDGLIMTSTYVDDISDWDMNDFLQSALLHDVGKIAIDELILNKPGKLTEEEYEIMKTHVAAGVLAIVKLFGNKEYTFPNHILLATGAHHEKWNGSGYPLGLRGTEIPLEGRLMAVVDVYDALTSERPYKRAMKHDVACRIIEDGSGSHFDPLLIDVFRKVKYEFAIIARDRTRLDSVGVLLPPLNPDRVHPGA